MGSPTAMPDLTLKRQSESQISKARISIVKEASWVIYYY